MAPIDWRGTYTFTGNWASMYVVPSRDDQVSPKPLLDKLGVKPSHRVAVLNLDQPWFVEQLLARTPDVYVQRRRVGLDLIFLGANDRGELRRVAGQRAFIKPDGAVWVVWPKGTKRITENDVRDAALAASLVDVKVVSFSDTHSALKLVVRLVDR